MPAGVYAVIEDDKLHIYGYHCKNGTSVKKELFGNINEPETLGKKMAEELKL